MGFALELIPAVMNDESLKSAHQKAGKHTRTKGEQ